MRTTDFIGFSLIQLAMENLISVNPDMEDSETLDTRLSQIFSTSENIIECEKASKASSSDVIDGSNVSMEEVQEYNKKGASFIVADANSISEWLVSSLNHLDEHAEEYATESLKLTQSLQKLKRTKVDAALNSRSIVRNLSVGTKVEPERIAVELDKFLTKIHAILKIGIGSEFQRLIGLLRNFEITGDNDDEKLNEIFQASRSYYKLIFPTEQKSKIYDLEVPTGRELWMDKNVYLGGKVFYSMTPTELSNTPGNLWSGFVRTTKDDLDLKAEFPCLTKAQSLEILKVLKRHINVFAQAKTYQQSVKQLLEVIKVLNTKYEFARRRQKPSPKPYILLMNLIVSHLYGIQVKAIGQTESVYKASLKYVGKSLKALESKAK